jgi:hypothetical protein
MATEKKQPKEWIPPEEEGSDEVAPAAETAPAKPRRSPLRSQRGHVAGSVEIDDNIYQYGQLPDALKEWMEARSQQLADKLGVSLEAFQADRYVPDTPATRAALASVPKTDWPELAKADEVEKLPSYIEETYDRVLADCLVSCDYPGLDFEREPALKKELAMEVKAKLVTQIGRSTRFGLSQQTFFPQRAG